MVHRVDAIYKNQKWNFILWICEKNKKRPNNQKVYDTWIVYLNYQIEDKANNSQTNEYLSNEY